MKTFIILLLYSMPVFHLAGQTQKVSDTKVCEVKGRIHKVEGKLITVDVGMPDLLPAKGIAGELSKHFETEMFGGVVQGYMAIGKMQVVGVEKNILSLNLLKELSEVTVNGEKKNHFVVGLDVKFVWKVPVPADEIAYQQGEVIYEDDIFKALQYYRQAINLNPDHDRALNMAGMAMSDLKLPDSALYYFQRAFATSPENGQYAKNVCISSSQAGKYQQAYEYANKAVQCDTSDAEAWYLRGLMLYILNGKSLSIQHQQSILNDLARAIAHNPEEPFYCSERAFIRYEFGDVAGACDDAKKARALGAADGDELVETYCE